MKRLANWAASAFLMFLMVWPNITVAKGFPTIGAVLGFGTDFQESVKPRYLGEIVIGGPIDVKEGFRVGFHYSSLSNVSEKTATLIRSSDQEWAVYLEKEFLLGEKVIFGIQGGLAGRQARVNIAGVLDSLNAQTWMAGLSLVRPLDFLSDQRSRVDLGIRGLFIGPAGAAKNVNSQNVELQVGGSFASLLILSYRGHIF